MKKANTNKADILATINQALKDGMSNGDIINTVATNFKITKPNAAYYVYRVVKVGARDKKPAGEHVVKESNYVTGFAPNVEKDWYKRVYGSGAVT